MKEEERKEGKGNAVARLVSPGLVFEKRRKRKRRERKKKDEGETGAKS